jgi:hypothetical protein
MWIIQSPTSSLFRALQSRTRARFELVNVPLLPPRVEFYTALPVYKGALRFMEEFRPSRISAPTGTGALQIALDLGKPGVFSIYNYT